MRACSVLWGCQARVQERAAALAQPVQLSFVLPASQSEFRISKWVLQEWKWKQKVLTEIRTCTRNTEKRIIRIREPLILESQWKVTKSKKQQWWTSLQAPSQPPGAASVSEDFLPKKWQRAATTPSKSSYRKHLNLGTYFFWPFRCVQTHCYQSFLIDLRIATSVRF